MSRLVNFPVKKYNKLRRNRTLTLEDRQSSWTNIQHWLHYAASEIQYRYTNKTVTLLNRSNFNTS